MNFPEFNPKTIGTRIEDTILDRIALHKYGVGRKHLHFRSNKWTFTKYDAEEYKSLGITTGKGGNMLQVIEKHRQELIDNPRTTIQPKPIRLLWVWKNGKKILLDYLVPFIRTYNVLLLPGLEQSAKRDTNDAGDSGVSHIQLGTDGSDEDENHSGIQVAAGDNKEYDVDGQRSVPTGTQIAKYLMTFVADDDGYSLPVIIQEAVQSNSLAATVSHSRIKIPAFTLEAGEAILTQINETMQNG